MNYVSAGSRPSWARPDSTDTDSGSLTSQELVLTCPQGKTRARRELPTLDSSPACPRQPSYQLRLRMRASASLSLPSKIGGAVHLPAKGVRAERRGAQQVYHKLAKLDSAQLLRQMLARHVGLLSNLRSFYIRKLGPVIQCVLANEHVLFRELFCKYMETSENIRIIGSHSDPQAAAQQAAKNKADVLLLAAYTRGNCAFKAARWLKAEFPLTKVLFFTRSVDPEHVRQALNAGAYGYVSTMTNSLARLVEIIEESYQQPANGMMFWPERRQIPRSPVADLTCREREVLKVLVEGNTAKESGMLLDMSSKTVEAHKYNLMRKLDIHSRTELVKFALVHHIITLATVSNLLQN